MTRRRWLVAGVVALAVAVIVLMWVTRVRPASDCDTVRQLVEYNQAHNESLKTASDSDNPSEAPTSDYEAWATQLKKYADGIHDARLAPHAKQVAALADQTVTIVGQARSDTAQSPASGPPPWAQKYSELDSQFKNELGALEAACPA